ncbi:MAG: TetR/AcrR family transcriptional regulator [Eubacteriaceae bacterium]|jgi:AcrR family transcriptional regulator|nr:TetR/AcrR family transcriptional regulator [Eubacteriaceae bacterium]
METNTKDIIIRTATKLFYQFGYNKTTLRKIAKTYGYSHTALFTYFKNKGEIGSILQTNYLYELVAQTKAFLKSHHCPEDDPLMAFYYYWYLHFTFLKKDRHFANFYFEYYEAENPQFVQVSLTTGKEITRDLFKLHLSRSVWVDRLNYEMITAMDMIVASHYSQDKITIDNALEYLYNFFYSNHYIRPTDASKDREYYIEIIENTTLPSEEIVEDLFD